MCLCPWPWFRASLSSERLSLALTLASDFFVSLALASSFVSSTPPLSNLGGLLRKLVYSNVSQTGVWAPVAMGVWQSPQPLGDFLSFWKTKSYFNPIRLPEVESRTQGSRPRPRTQKKSEAKAKDSLS